MQGIRLYYGDRIDKLGAYCTRVKLGQPYIPNGESEYVYPVIMDPQWDVGHELGGNGSNNRSMQLSCRTNGPNTGIHGLRGRVTDELHAIAPLCSSMEVRRISGAWALKNWDTGNFQEQGGSGGAYFERGCPAGSLMTKLNARTTHLIRNVSWDCARPTVPIKPIVP